MLVDAFTAHVAQIGAITEAGDRDAIVPIVRKLNTKFPPDIAARNRHDFGPSHELLRRVKTGRINWEQYRFHFRAALNHRRYDEAVSLLGSVQNGPPILMCYCASPTQCHRHILAEWLRCGGFDARPWSPQRGLF